MWVIRKDKVKIQCHLYILGLSWYYGLQLTRKKKSSLNFTIPFVVYQTLTCCCFGIVYGFLITHWVKKLSYSKQWFHLKNLLVLKALSFHNMLESTPCFYMNINTYLVYLCNNRSLTTVTSNRPLKYWGGSPPRYSSIIEVHF